MGRESGIEGHYADIERVLQVLFSSSVDLESTSMPDAVNIAMK